MNGWKREDDMKTTQRDRKAFIDHLERKYIKKIQNRAFQKETSDVKKMLFDFRGGRHNSAADTSDIKAPTTWYRLHYL